MTRPGAHAETLPPPAPALVVRAGSHDNQKRTDAVITLIEPPAVSVECQVCQELDRAEAVARTERDLSKVTDCRVLRARHRAVEHTEQS